MEGEDGSESEDGSDSEMFEPASMEEVLEDEENDNNSQKTAWIRKWRSKKWFGGTVQNKDATCPRQQKSGTDSR